MKLSRRQFLRGSAVVGGGLLIGFQLTGCDATPYPDGDNEVFRPNAFVQIDRAGQIIFHLPKAEMGQGVYTGLTTILAEELAVDPRRIEVRFAQVHPDYKDPVMRLMTTGGSTSVKDSYDVLRKAGASARAMLVAAAAQRWQVTTDSLTAEDGAVLDAEGRRLEYGELAEEAARQPLPARPALTDPAKFRYIGRFDDRLDARAKVDGSARYGLDLSVPNMVTAVVVRNPRFDGGWERYDGSGALAVPGVEELVELPHGIAVVARGYWAARKGAEALEVSWQGGATAGYDSETLEEEQRQLLEEGEARTLASEGRVVTSGERIEAEYHVPYLAHATMEPQNCIADVREEGVELWLGNQGPDTIQDAVSRALGRPRAEIRVHNAMLGGGFGRRIMPDSAIEAALISRQLQRPVKLVWSREDDMRHDFYRPTVLARMSAQLEGNRLRSLGQRMVCPSLSRSLMPLFLRAVMPEWAPERLVDRVGVGMGRGAMFAGEGAVDQPYVCDHLLVEHIQHDVGVPVGFWRSVGHSHNAFFIEGFIDELAHAAGSDPADFRRANLPEDSIERQVLELLVERSRWGQPAEGRAQGLAVHSSFGSTVGQVAEISVEGERFTVHRVTCVVECGQVINPDVVVAQMESGILFGLTAALYGDIRLRDGAVEQSNFHDYPLLRMHETPEIEVIIAPSERGPSGVGEPGVPPIAPAVANALFAATGQRLRRMPLKLSADSPAPRGE